MIYSKRTNRKFSYFMKYNGNG